MNRALLRLSLACLAMFVLLLVNVNYLQGFRSSSLAAEKGNIRVFDQQFQYQRGSIKAGANTTIAASRPVKGNSGTYRRYYPHPEVYAPITGYDSVYSETGLEAAENKELSGTDPRLAVHNLISLITGKGQQGGTVYTTISPVAQQAAYSALVAQGKEAGVVALDPRTGAILAMASYPSFNPNKYTTLNGTRLNRIDKAYQLASGHPLLNHTTQLTYHPGSSFKIITSAAALATGKVASPQATIPAPTTLPLGGGTLTNDSGPCGDGHPQMIFAFTLSCNTAFGLLGQKVTGPVLRNYADRFGFNNPNLTVPLPVVPSVFPRVTDPNFTALQAIGQSSDEITPLQEAIDAEAVANGGTEMTPFLVREVQAPDLSQVQGAAPQVLARPISATVASQLTQMMISVTSNPAGTAYATANPGVAGVQIAGKTGTAQTGVGNTGTDDAVFTCFAPASHPTIAVGVIVKGGGFGADAAAPIAVKIIRAYLGIK